MSNGTMTIQGEAAYGAGIRAARKVAKYEARVEVLEAQVARLEAQVAELRAGASPDFRGNRALGEDGERYVFEWETYPSRDADEDMSASQLDADSAGYPTW